MKFVVIVLLALLSGCEGVIFFDPQRRNRDRLMALVVMAVCVAAIAWVCKL